MQQKNQINKTQRTQNAIDIVNTNAIDTNEYEPPDADSRYYAFSMKSIKSFE